MKSDIVLFQSDKFSFKLNHLIIIGVLILAFSTSMLIRSQPMEYGFQLNEFDSFFNFRATEYIVENGFSEYFEWHDDKTWYPTGRNVSHSSQFMLHVTTAITYQIFGGNSSLYDYTILFPAVIGSVTVVVIFGLVRLFAGTSADLNHPIEPLMSMGKDIAKSKDAIKPAEVPANNLTNPKITTTVSEPITAGNIIV